VPKGVHPGYGSLGLQRDGLGLSVNDWGNDILKLVFDALALASDLRRLRRAVREYGNERTKKFFDRALRANELHAA
jgi:hypothetical protein